MGCARGKHGCRDDGSGHDGGAPIPMGQSRGRHASDSNAGLALHVIGRADERYGHVERVDINT